MFSNFKKTKHFWRRWCARKHTFVNKFSNLSPQMLQSLWNSTRFTMSSKSTMTLVKTLFIKIMIWWLIWNNVILDRFARKLISCKACRLTRSGGHLFVWVYGKGCFCSYLISLSANHGICAVLSTTSTSENYSPYAQRVLSLVRLDAWVVEPERQFVTERGKKKQKAEILSHASLSGAYILQTLRVYTNEVENKHAKNKI